MKLLMKYAISAVAHSFDKYLISYHVISSLFKLLPLTHSLGSDCSGHKQRGAGTIITAKAPIVTGDGIILKIHERLPSQLLQEYCQKEKRPAPKYFPEPPGHRYIAVVTVFHYNGF